MGSLRRRNLPADHFTMIDNDWLRDETLTWAERGLLGWLASHAVDFDITETAIIEAGPAGRDAVRAMIHGLENAGYLRRERAFLPGGGSTVDYILSNPQDDTEDGESVTSPDQAEQALFPVPVGGGNSAPPSLQEDQKKTKKTSSSRRTATRLPENFQPTERMKAWFAAEKLGEVIDGKREHAQFVDYWIAEAGTKARKLDWAATWRRWMRKAAADATRRRPYGAPGNSVMPAGGPMHPMPPIGAYRPSTTDQKIAQTLELGRRLMMEETQ